MTLRKIQPGSAKPAASPARPLEQRGFAGKAAFSSWLGRHHASKAGLWLKLAKKGASVPSLTYAEALEVALCWGWIDGQTKALDERFFLRKFTPRGARSVWSKINRDNALLLIASGEMQPAGLEQVERAKRDGRFARAYDSPKNAKAPPDLADALRRSPRAQAFYDQLEARNRYAILFRIQTAKRPETRTRRIAQFIEMLERGEKIHP